MTVIERDRPQAVEKRRSVLKGDILAQPRFTMAQISNAADASTETVRTWFKRNVITLGDDERLGHAPEAVGLGRMLTGYTAMAVAIMARLTIVKHRARETGGYNLEAAWDAASVFVFKSSDERKPCHLYAEGQTALLIAKDGRYPGARVVNLSVAGTESWDELRQMAQASSQFEILLLDELWQTVFQRLGMRAQLERGE